MKPWFGKREHSEVSVFVSKSLFDAKTRYYRMEKMATALFVVSRKRKQYFQSFQIIVLTEHPLKSIVENLQATGQIAKWATELRPYGIKYEPRTAIQEQVLANFITEFTLIAPTQSDLLEGGTLTVDGASNSKGSGIEMVLTTLEGSIIEQSYTLSFFATYNDVEYEAVIVGLRMTATHGVTELEVRCDFLLVVSQVNGEYVAKDDRMAVYMQIVLSLKFRFPCCDFKPVSRLENNHTDFLANLAFVVEH